MKNMKQFKLKSGFDKKCSNTLYLFSSEKELKAIKAIPSYQQEIISKDKEKKEFIFQNDTGLNVLVKTGESLEQFRKSGYAFYNYANTANETNWNIHFSAKEEYNFAFLEGFALSSYSFEKYKSEKKSKKFEVYVEEGLSKAALQELETLVDATCIARTLVNEPHSFLNATQYSKEIESLGKKFGFKLTVFDKAKIIKEKMGGILAVNKGSIQHPTFNILEYKPSKAVNKKPIILVGKGVMYDTGGLSLKPTPNSMDMMKSDMGGSAAVVGAFCAVAGQNLPLHIIGLIPATDNRPGLDAVAPGDVITMYSGKTVEVLNTDAEGRLVLADALHYAKKYKPEFVIDLATLTGAAARAIGPQGVACMGNASEELKNDLKASGNKVHERMVEFPMWEEYESMLKSDIADINNLGGPVAGQTTAGMFLQHFVDYPWMHIDIAGAAFLKSTDSYRGKNGTGVGVRLLYDFLKNRSKK
jgi:leucyl aminopeptidase